MNLTGLCFVLALALSPQEQTPSDRVAPAQRAAFEKVKLTGGRTEIYNAGLNLCGALEKQARFSEAQALLGETLEALDRVDSNEFYQPFVYRRLAELHVRRMEWTQAQDAVQAARDGIDKGHYPAAHAGAVVGLHLVEARLRIALGHPDRASGILESAQAKMKEILDRDGDDVGTRASLDLALSDLYLARREFGRVIDHVAASLDDEVLFHGEREPDRRSMELKRAVAEAALEERDPTRPRIARPTLERILGDPVAKPATHLAASIVLATTLNREGLPEASLAQLEETTAKIENKTWAASPRELARMEALRAQIALETGAPALQLEAHLNKLRGSYSELLQIWLDAPIHPAVFNLSGPMELLATLVQLELAVHGPGKGAWQSLQSVVDAQLIGGLADHFGIRSCPVSAVQAELLEKEDVLALLIVGRRISYLFVVTDASVRAYEAAPQKALLEVIRVWNQELTRPSREVLDAGQLQAREGVLRELGQRVLDALFAPEAAEAIQRDGTRLTFVGADQVGYVPLAALPTASGALLGDEHAVGFLSSLPVGLGLARSEAPIEPSEYDFVVVAGPSHGTDAQESFPHLDAVSLISDFTRDLQDPFGAARTRTLAGDAATWSSIASKDLQRARAMTILAHGVEDPLVRFEPGIILAGDTDWLLTAEVLESSKTPWLSVLGVCGASRGPWRRGDPDGSQLVGSFLRSGSRTVIHAETEIAAAGTQVFLAALHRALADGHSSAEALRQARLELAADPAWQDPYYRCLIQATGLTHRPVFTGRTPQNSSTRSSGGRLQTTAFAALGLALASLAGWIALKRRPRAA